VETIIESIVDIIVVPLANLVPVLVSSGVALLIFALLWAAFGVALVRDRSRLDDAWQWLRGLPWIVQALAWLLFLPVLVGLRVWRAGWPLVGRLVTIGGLAGWSLLIFIPQAA
jgi:hypothetical protein